MKKLFVLFIALTLIAGVTTMNSCKKKDENSDTTTAKKGTVTFDRVTEEGAWQTVVINGQTIGWTDYSTGYEASCGEVSPYCGTVVLPEGTYTFTWNSAYDPYPGPNSVTVTEGSCTLVRW